MEKRHRSKSDNLIRVVITGPESTGKSTLAARLAAYFQTEFVPEYARDFLEALDRPCTYRDVEHVAQVQIKQVRGEFNSANRIVFLDTWLIITKVWFDVVYGHHPELIDEELQSGLIDLYLLCDTGIPWIPDKVRENGGEMRELLFSKYQAEIERLNCNYAIISGSGEERFLCALEAIERFFPDICTNSKG